MLQPETTQTVLNQIEKFSDVTNATVTNNSRTPTMMTQIIQLVFSHCFFVAEGNFCGIQSIHIGFTHQKFIIYLCLYFVVLSKTKKKKWLEIQMTFFFFLSSMSTVTTTITSQNINKSFRLRFSGKNINRCVTKWRRGSI